jgi:FkbM family methyltransferase
MKLPTIEENLLTSVYNKNIMTQYSQGQEQEIIFNYLFPNNQTYSSGVFLDLGANDGITLSNTRGLYELGWSGVCVEPSPKAFQKLSELYNGIDKVQLVNVAVGNNDGTATFYESGEHLKKGDIALLSTLKQEEIERWKGTEQFTPTTTEVKTFNSLLSVCNFTKFDFVSIDCEGVDYNILSQIDFNAINTKLVCVEFNQIAKEKYVEYCSRFGMRLIFENFENLIFGR